MIRRVLKIGRWVVDFLFATRRYDIEGVLACLCDAGAPDYIMDEAEELMESCEYDCGFTYTNQRKRRAVVLIGPTTSSDEFLNTVSHEARHLADAIAKSVGVELDSETPAYMTGDTIKALAEVICELGCPHCR
jgi:hypothetical protein